MKPGAENSIIAQRAGAEVAATELDHAEWERAQPVAIRRYWSGAEAPVGRHAEARIIWTETALCVRFVCRQEEPLVIAEAPLTTDKTIGLWERDVCEIFIAPEARVPERYFEFEAAPTGEWLDLAIHWRADGRETDWHFNSGMTAAGRISTEERTVMIAMRVPWRAFFERAEPPQANERWRVNLFRCVGAGAGRGYLAWRPTRTERPDFHLPEAFGWLYFDA